MRKGGWGEITRVGNSQANWFTQQIRYRGRTSKALVVYPFGYHANAAVGSMVLWTAVGDDASNKAAFAFDHANRPDLKENEVALYIPKTNTIIKLVADESILIESDTKLVANVPEIESNSTNTVINCSESATINCKDALIDASNSITAICVTMQITASTSVAFTTPLATFSGAVTVGTTLGVTGAISGGAGGSFVGNVTGPDFVSGGKSGATHTHSVTWTDAAGTGESLGPT